MSNLRVSRTLLRAAKVGPAAPFGPGGVSSGLIIWLKANAIVGLSNNDDVPNWDDSSGAGNHFSAVTVFPIYHTGQINGLPAVYYPFVTNADHLMTAAWQGGTPTAGECFCVCKADADPAASASGGGIWRFGNAGTQDHITLNDGHCYLGWGRNTRPDIGDLTPSFSSWRRLNIWSVTNDYSFQVDTTTVYSTATNTVGFISQPTLSDGGTMYVGHIAEYIQYNRKLSAGERTNVDDYLKAKYALT